MVRELRQGLKYNNIFLILALSVVALAITGCTSGGVAQKYYTGYDSVEMSLMTDSPPTMFYYDSTALSGSQANTIPINVQIQNMGSSDSYGALFIHGFDPHIVAVQGYSQGYPGYSGPIMGAASFGGWFNGQGSYSFNVGGLGIGGANSPISLNLGATHTTDGRTIVSFAGFSADGTRAGLFRALGLQVGTGLGGTAVSASVAQSRVGQILNPITKAMFTSAYQWGVGTWLKTFELEGRNPDNPAGGMDVVEFPATIINLPPSLEQFTQRVMITSCFDYATHASTMVCLDPEPYSNVKKACNPMTVSLGGGQGAPVAITSIEQRPGRGRTTFTINIRLNKKDSYDELYDYFSLYKCNPASGEIVKATDKNIVYIGYVYLSDYDITMNCIPDQMIRLDTSGTGQITCSITFPPGTASSAYQAPMEVELWYGYSKTVYRDIIVKKI